MITRTILIFYVTLLIFQFGFKLICGEITYTLNIYQIDPKMMTFERSSKKHFSNFEIYRIWSLEQYSYFFKLC